MTIPIPVFLLSYSLFILTFPWMSVLFSVLVSVALFVSLLSCVSSCLNFSLYICSSVLSADHILLQDSNLAPV